ncbi:MAG: magnesium transporter [Parvicellaceae bacterium]|jgi:magnesium transporter
MKATKQRSSLKKGLPPGSLVYIGRERNDIPTISVIDYTAAEVGELALKSASDCEPYKGKKSVTWFNVNGIHDSNLMKELQGIFKIHPLVMEDIMNTHHRPKVEFANDYIFFTLKMIRKDAGSDLLQREQVSFVFGENYIISFQEVEGDVFDPIRERIRSGKGKVRQKGSEYLIYLLMDVVIDQYMEITDSISDQIEILEDRLIKGTSDTLLLQIIKLKKNLLFMKKAIDPLKEAISKIQKECNEESVKYFDDLHDHILHETESINAHKEALIYLTDLHQSQLSNKMNEVMKVLTIMASIFIPLTFIAGIYGMNFKHMPELAYKWAYPSVWIVMISVALLMLVYFKKKKWLFSSKSKI